MVSAALKLEFISTDAKSIIIEGLFNGPSFYLYTGSGKRLIDVSEGVFIFSIPLSDLVEGDRVTFRNDEGISLDILFGEHFRLSSMRHSYSSIGRWLVVNGGGYIDIYQHSTIRHIFLEIMFIFRIIFNWNIDRAIRQIRSSQRLTVSSCVKSIAFILEAIIRVPESLFIRLAYYATKPLIKRNIWIISDRGMSAGDNGEALYRYAVSKNDPSVSLFFAVSRKSPDYRRMKKVGRVVNVRGVRYKLLFLHSTNIISSHADIEVTNPFFRIKGRFVGLFNFNFIFLQHGVIRHDLSTWLNRYEKNIRLFVTSAKKEYDSILNYPYGYDKKNLLLSGLPRFDYLNNSRQRKVILAPTYRADLLRLKTNYAGSRPYDPEFKKSGYYRFYNRLINDPRLVDTLEDYDYDMSLYLHPNFQAQRKDFAATGRVYIPEYPYDYKKAISEGALLISDYSSIVFDFAYLKKPVIYVKFDEDNFYDSHVYSRGDFFDDHEDGFGPVVESYEGLVDEVIDYIKSGCVMGEEYIERVNSFFYRIDNNNSKRVYNAIKLIED